jgi:TM2 domain-containing membrane protein YozV
MSEDNTKYCPYCGVQIEKKYDTCPNCGKPQPAIDGVERVITKPKKNPLIAALLSLIITGTGQIYVGKVWRGVAYLAVVLAVSFVPEDIISFEMMMGIGVVISIISAIDAYYLAKATNQA